MRKVFLSLFAILVLYAQGISQRVLRGVVLSVYNEPLENVAITYADSDSIITYTDKKGHFRIKIKPDSAFFIFNYEGFKKMEFVPKTTDSITIYFPISLVSTKSPPIMGIEGRADYDPRKYTLSLSAEDLVRSSIARGEPTKKKVIEPKSGLLTAGEVNDFAKWKLWQDITNNELKSYVDKWNIYPHKRFCVQVLNQDKLPIVNAVVRLYDQQGDVQWIARTDNTGKAELWAGMFNWNRDQKNNFYDIAVYYDGETYTIKKVKEFFDGINTITLPVKTKYPDTVDVAFVIDITGSMSDELKYLQAEISDIISKVKYKYNDLVYRVAIVVYKDLGDDIVYSYKNFDTDIQKAIAYLVKFQASGGGDYPESVDSAMFVAVNKLSWSDKARTKIIFLVLDAPPHNEQQNVYTIDKAVYTAAQKGIRIVPLSCSGIDKSTEYLLRSMALATNGTYTFLTDDSGIGNSHIKPTTDKYDVELMHDLFIRIMKSYIEVPYYDTTVNVNTVDTLVRIDSVVSHTDTSQYIVFQDVMKFYPNPTKGKLTVEILLPIKKFYIADITGKLLQRYVVDDKKKIAVDISMYASGIYLIEYYRNNRRYSGKIVLMH